MYFVKNNPKDCCCERHRINIPTLGWVRLKEKRYLPTTKDGWRIRSKYENLKKMRKGESAQRANIQKQKLRVQKLHQRINQIRTDYINKTIAEIVKTKPSHITIEDLNVKSMMKNRHLSKAVASEKFYEFREKLMMKCHEEGIELRVVSRCSNPSLSFLTVNLETICWSAAEMMQQSCLYLEMSIPTKYMDIEIYLLK